MKSLLKFASLLLLAGQASAAPVIYSGADVGAASTDPRPNSNAAAASFATAAGPTNLITFESAPLGSFSSLTIATGVTVSGASNLAILNAPVNTPEALYGYNTTAGGSKYLSIAGGSLTFNFATAIDAFGAYFTGAQSPEFGTVTLTFNDGTTQTENFASANPNGGVQYLGFVDAGALITAVTVNAQADYMAADDISYGPVSASVPDNAGTALLLSVGLAGVLVWQRRARRDSQAL